jgi:NDP-sugar pyrophosphorylase family protein
LGTGGALRLAFPWIDTPRVLVLNGDSYCGADLRQFAEFHHANRADLSMLLVQVANTERFGQVEVDDDSRVCAFREKGASHGTGWINAGIYLIERRLITAIPTGRPVSLEREMIPVWMQGKFFGQRAAGSFLDIGTPESYAAAAKFFAPRVAA